MNILNKGVLSLVMSLAFVGTMFANGPFEQSSLNCWDDISASWDETYDCITLGDDCTAFVVAPLHCYGNPVAER